MWVKIDDGPPEIGWMVYPYPPGFWRRTTVRAISPHLAYFGPLPQSPSRSWRYTLLPAYVYVIQDAEGEVLYVGKTVNPVGRLASHRAKKDWWPKVGQLTLLGIEADDRTEADAISLRLEALAIRELQPLYNIAGVVR